MATSATVILVMVLLMMTIEIAMETRSSALAHQDYVLFSSLLIVFVFCFFFCHKFTDARTLGNAFFCVFPAAEASIIVITLQEFRIYRP